MRQPKLFKSTRPVLVVGAIPSPKRGKGKRGANPACPCRGKNPKAKAKSKRLSQEAALREFLASRRGKSSTKADITQVDFAAWEKALDARHASERAASAATPTKRSPMKRSKKRRTAAQKAATKRMIAANKKRAKTPTKKAKRAKKAAAKKTTRAKIVSLKGPSKLAARVLRKRATKAARSAAGKKAARTRKRRAAAAAKAAGAAPVKAPKRRKSRKARKGYKVVSAPRSKPRKGKGKGKRKPFAGTWQNTRTGKRIRLRRNPLFNGKSVLVGVGTTALGRLIAEMVDRWIATQPAQDGAAALHGGMAQAAIIRGANWKRLLASGAPAAAFGVVGGLLAYYNRTGWAMASLGMGFGFALKFVPQAATRLLGYSEAYDGTETDGWRGYMNRLLPEGMAPNNTADVVAGAFDPGPHAQLGVGRCGGCGSCGCGGCRGDTRVDAEVFTADAPNGDSPKAVSGAVASPVGRSANVSSLRSMIEARRASRASR